MVDPVDSKRLTLAAKRGKVSWRETLLGGCTKRGPCEFGGVDNVIRCGGGDGKSPCADALFDREREEAIRQLGDVIVLRIAQVPDGSPGRESLNAQLLAVENALHVISNQ